MYLYNIFIFHHFSLSLALFLIIICIIVKITFLSFPTFGGLGYQTGKYRERKIERDDDGNISTNIVIHCIPYFLIYIFYN